MALFIIGNGVFLPQQASAQNTFPSNGNVGIGIASPSEKLDVQGDVKISTLSGNGDRYVVTDPSGKLKVGPPVIVPPGGGNPNAFWNTLGNNNVTNSNFIGTLNSADFVLKTYGLERMRISSSGNIGIGIGTAQEKLHVFGNAKISGIVTSDSIITNKISATKLHVLDSLKVGANSIWIGGVIPNSGNNHIYATSGALVLQSQAKSNYNTIINGNNKGMVGIGTTAPERNLHVKARTCTNCMIGNNPVETVFIRLEDELHTSTGTFVANHKWDIGASANFYIQKSGKAPMFTVTENNRVGIGTSTPSSKLHIKLNATDGNTHALIIQKSNNEKILQLTNDGLLLAREIKVDVASWPDFVFEKKYDLMPLKQVETFITENKHLPNVPDAKTVESEGINLGEMNKILLQKVEELTLYLIEQDKRIQTLEQELNTKK